MAKIGKLRHREVEFPVHVHTAVTKQSYVTISQYVDAAYYGTGHWKIVKGYEISMDHIWVHTASIQMIVSESWGWGGDRESRVYIQVASLTSPVSMMARLKLVARCW